MRAMFLFLVLVILATPVVAQHPSGGFTLGGTGGGSIGAVVGPGLVMAGGATWLGDTDRFGPSKPCINVPDYPIMWCFDIMLHGVKCHLTIFYNSEGEWDAWITTDLPPPNDGLFLH